MAENKMTKEVLKAAKGTGSVEELQKLAKENGMELDAAQAEFEASPVSWANFHVFRRDAQTISLVDKEKADEDSAPTNSKLLS